MVFWVAIIFVSVLIHECGHAFTAKFFQQKVQIQLVALGGVTLFEGPPLRFWQQFVIAFNGPLFGFFLFLGSSALLTLDLSKAPLIYPILKTMQMANLFWTLVNILPILPLDGGQLLRIALEGFFGVKGFRASLAIGAFLALLISLLLFIVQAFFAGAIFFLFAFQGFDSWRKSRFALSKDRDEEIHQYMTRGEQALREGRRHEAMLAFEEVRQKAEGGILASAACQYLAFLEEAAGRHKEAYALLVSQKTHLEEDGLCLLHRLAANQKDYALVAELSSDCYSAMPSFETALNNARAFAALKQPKSAGGWLQTARTYKALDLEQLFAEEEFTPLKNDLEFLSFFQ